MKGSPLGGTGFAESKGEKRKVFISQIRNLQTRQRRLSLR